MRKILGILVCLWVATGVFAVDYHPIKATGYRSAGRYTSAYSAPVSSFRSTSAYSAPLTANSLSTTPTGGLTSSLAAISSSNFDALNSEGGACYQPSALSSGPRRGVTRPGSDDEDEDPDEEDLAIGEYIERSPVGDTPWIFIAILIIVYFFRAKMCTGLNRSLVLVKSWLRPDQTKRPKS